MIDTVPDPSFGTYANGAAIAAHAKAQTAISATSVRIVRSIAERDGQLPEPIDARLAIELAAAADEREARPRTRPGHREADLQIVLERLAIDRRRIAKRAAVEERVPQHPAHIGAE